MHAPFSGFLAGVGQTKGQLAAAVSHPTAGENAGSSSDFCPPNA